MPPATPGAAEDCLHSQQIVENVDKIIHKIAKILEYVDIIVWKRGHNIKEVILKKADKILLI